jgi:hypothetical protein
MVAKKQIGSYKERISRLVKQLSQSSEMLQGSVIEKYVKCGKGNCRCTEGEGHGPVYYLSFKEKGITKLIYLPHDEVDKVKHQVNKFRKFKQIGSEVARMNREILKLRRKE